MELTLKQAEDFVDQNSGRGYFWDGYTIVRWVRNNNGYSMPNGSFKNGVWGVEFRTPMSDNGTWSLKRV